MDRLILTFFLRLSVSSLLAFGAHLLLLDYFEYPLFEDKIVLGYVLNIFLAIFIFLVLIKLRKKFNDQLGFLFLFGSLIKFAAFFIFFYPDFRSDGQMSRSEFFAFFIPYVVCLFTETLSVIALVNSPQKSN